MNFKAIWMKNLTYKDKDQKAQYLKICVKVQFQCNKMTRYLTKKKNCLINNKILIQIILFKIWKII